MLMSSTRRTRPAPAWGRNKLVALLAAVAAAGLLLVAGLALAVYYTLHPDRHGSAPHPTDSVPTRPAASGATTTTAPANSSQGRQDALAAKPMPSLDPDLATPGTVSTRDPGTIALPQPTRTGPAGVPTGFPHTAAGALSQLAAIDQTALQSGSVAGVRQVIAGWAAPHGPSPQSWSGVQAMAEFLDAAGLSGGGSPQLSLVVTPLMGLIKGSVGTDFVIPCVDFEVDATLSQTQRVAVADCQRLVWQADRWVIGPGVEPATPPSVWPDTDPAIDVGYKDLRHG
jgi:hypothetical protein